MNVYEKIALGCVAVCSIAVTVALIVLFVKVYS